MSLTLDTAETISGVAGSATAITYTITGDEISGGADDFKVLAQGQLPSSAGTLYTVPASTQTIVKSIHLANTTVGSVTARLNVNGTAAANAILPPITILAGGFAVFADEGWKVYNDQGQLLSVGATGAAGATGEGLTTGGTAGQFLRKLSGTDYDAEWALADLPTVTINFVIDGGGSTITTGVKGDVRIPFACTVTSWSLLADTSGSIVVDIWKDTLANFPPTDADAMPGSGKEPTITTATNAEDTTITDWTTDDIAAGDVLRFNVDSCTSITRATLALKATRV